MTFAASGYYFIMGVLLLGFLCHCKDLATKQYPYAREPMTRVTEIACAILSFIVLFFLALNRP